MLLALENQISQELNSPIAIGAERVPTSPPQETRLPNGTPRESIAKLGLSVTVPPNWDAVSRTVADYGWMWGLVNRILPIKVAARTLLEMSGPVPLETGKARAADAAAMLAVSLRARGAGSASRDESLLIGLPSRDPLFRAKQRYADHFVGRIDGSGRLWGALFELGLAGAEQGKQALISLTEQGRQFAALANPILDEGSLLRTLSDEEMSFYNEQVVPEVPRERDCFLAVLEALAENSLRVAELDGLAARVLGNATSADSASSQKTAAIGRLRELGLLSRKSSGRDVSFIISDRGRRYLDILRSRIGEPRTAAATGKVK